jgi:hypothetical protein
MTTGDIQTHLAEIYGTEISRETISKITDTIVEEMLAWQNRPLDPAWIPLVLASLRRRFAWFIGHGTRALQTRRLATSS